MLEPVEPHEDAAHEDAPAHAVRAPSSWLVVLLAVLLSGVLSALVATAVVRSQSRTNPQSVDLGNNVTITENSAIERVAATDLPAVVSIETQLGSSTARGSGFLVTKDGFIVSDTRAVANATSLSVFFAGDPKPHDARLVDSDCSTGIAVLKVDAVSDMPTLGFGDSNALKLGQTVVALGGPLESQGRVVHGIVSDVHRGLVVSDPVDAARQVQRSDSLRIDSPVTSGDSGGPLLNVAGEVVGVTAVAPGDGAPVAFAVPAGQVQAEIEQVVQTGQLNVPLLDAQWTDLSPAQAAARQVDAGALVTAVTPGGVSEQGGVRVGDVLTQVNEVKVDQSHALRTILMTQFRAGQRVAVTLQRGGSSTQVQVTLDSGHPVCS